MGNKKEFLTVKRKAENKRKIKERLNDFKEIYIPLKEEEIINQASRCMDCGVPFCHGHGCPLSNLIPEFNEMIFKGKWKKAFEILYAKNPFADITGKVCPALCEEACVAGESGDAVIIKQIELAVMEKAYENGWMKPNIPLLRRKEKIAVIGSGPAGLAAAYALNQEGFNVTVFEKQKQPGGMLYYGIPDFKLSKHNISRRIDILKKEGIEFKTEVCAGKDIAFSYLTKNFNALVLALGAWTPRDINAPGRNLKGVHFAMDYLPLQVKKNNGEKFKEEFITAKNKKVVVLGGGDTGADCAGAALRQGAKEVYQVELLPAPPLTRPQNQPWPDYPFILRESTSHEEGTKRIWSYLTEKFKGKDGRVNEIHLRKIKWENKDGGMIFKKTKTKKIIKCGLVLIAAGFTGATGLNIINSSGIALKNNFIKAENNITPQRNIFAAGDAVSGPSLAVRAFSSGFEAARRIIKKFDAENKKKAG